MFSMCSELTPRAPIPDTRIPQLMQPCLLQTIDFVRMVAEQRCNYRLLSWFFLDPPGMQCLFNRCCFRLLTSSSSTLPRPYILARNSSGDLRLHISMRPFLISLFLQNDWQIINKITIYLCLGTGRRFSIAGEGDSSLSHLLCSARVSVRA